VGTRFCGSFVPERRRNEEIHHQLRRARHHASGADFVPPAERIAVFDNDGTLWAEQPIYFQLAFAIDRAKAVASHVQWLFI
jgi:hypothetical protein